MKSLPKTIYALLSAIFLTFTAVFATACAPKVTAYTLRLWRFNTLVSVEVYDKPIENSVKEQITNLLIDLDEELSTSNPSSKISEFNNANANEEIIFSNAGVELIARAISFYTYTDGKFNLAVYPLVKLWKFSADEYNKTPFSPPSNEDIINTKALCKPSFIQINGNAVTKTQSEVMIDLGGLAKGYAVNAIKDILVEAGHVNGYVNIGGSSMHILALKGENNFLSIRHPRKTDTAILKFKRSYVNDKAVSTSGDYERYYEYDGKRYSHIIDATSGKPADTGIISATVLGGDPCFLDALTTALCLTPRNELESLISRYSSNKFFIFYNGQTEKQLITNEKQSENFALLDSEYTIVEI